MKRTTATRFYIQRVYPLRCGNPLEATNLLRECVLRLSVSVCVCVFVWHQKLCSSHCQSQITNDTNSPRALTISTLTRSPSLHNEHTHTNAGTHSIVHSLSNSLARSHTHIASQPKGGSTTQERNETSTKPEMRCRSKQVTCSPL